MKYKNLFLLVCLILVLSVSASAENNQDIIEFKKNLVGIDTSDTQLYLENLEIIIENARNQGAPFAELIIVALEVGIPIDLFMTAAMKVYPIKEVVTAVITSGGDPAESIKTAILAGGDPAEVEAGAIAANISPVEAATMVSVALNIMVEQEEKNRGKKRKDEEGLGRSPGDAGEGTGGIPGGGGVGPVGGSGGGVASPS